MSDFKTLLLLVISIAAVGGIWWLGWFEPIITYLMAVKRLTTH